MPPRRFSRHIFTSGVTDARGRTVLTDRVPFRFRDLPDNRHHLVGAGDTLQNLAARFFDGVDRADGLWWVIADFQPDPIFDPTVALVPGSTLVIPSMKTLLELVFSERRRAEHAS
jgi:hypothetical protein